MTKIKPQTIEALIAGLYIMKKYCTSEDDKRFKINTDNFLLHLPFDIITIPLDSEDGLRLQELGFYPAFDGYDDGWLMWSG